MIPQEAGIGKPFSKMLQRMLKLKAAGTLFKSLKLLPGRSVGALTNWTSKSFQVGGDNVLLTKERMGHFLERHHPRYWDGSFATEQSFFEARMTIGDVEDIVRQVVNQNQAKIIANGGTNVETSIEGTVNGLKYAGKVDGGRVVQFYPK
jgi:hypothetical protein